MMTHIQGIQTQDSITQVGLGEIYYIFSMLYNLLFIHITNIIITYTHKHIH